MAACDRNFLTGAGLSPSFQLDVWEWLGELERRLRKFSRDLDRQEAAERRLRTIDAHCRAHRSRAYPCSESMRRGWINVLHQRAARATPAGPEGGVRSRCPHHPVRASVSSIPAAGPRPYSVIPLRSGTACCPPRSAPARNCTLPGLG